MDGTEGHLHQNHTSAMFQPLPAEVALCPLTVAPPPAAGAAILPRIELGGAARDLKVPHRWQHLACALLADLRRSSLLLPTLLPMHVSSVLCLLGCSAHSDAHFCLLLVAHGPSISKQNYLPALHPNGLLCSVITPQEGIGQGNPWPPSLRPL